MSAYLIDACSDIVRNLTVCLAYALSKCNKCDDCPYGVPEIIKESLDKAEDRLRIALNTREPTK